MKVLNFYLVVPTCNSNCFKQIHLSLGWRIWCWRSCDFSILLLEVGMWWQWLCIPIQFTCGICVHPLGYNMQFSNVVSSSSNERRWIGLQLSYKALQVIKSRLEIIGLVGTYLKLIQIFVSSKNKMSMELEVCWSVVNVFTSVCTWSDLHFLWNCYSCSLVYIMWMV
jgi:hypothetical protein